MENSQYFEQTFKLIYLKDNKILLDSTDVAPECPQLKTGNCCQQLKLSWIKKRIIKCPANWDNTAHYAVLRCSLKRIKRLIILLYALPLTLFITSLVGMSWVNEAFAVFLALFVSLGSFFILSCKLEHFFIQHLQPYQQKPQIFRCVRRL